jgi:hypothetical protein
VGLIAGAEATAGVGLTAGVGMTAAVDKIGAKEKDERRRKNRIASACYFGTKPRNYFSVINYPHIAIFLNYS